MNEVIAESLTGFVEFVIPFITYESAKRSDNCSNISGAGGCHRSSGYGRP
jgi:hypothetical protein